MLNKVLLVIHLIQLLFLPMGYFKCVVTSNYEKFLIHKKVKIKNRIIDGWNAQEEYPFMVSIFRLNYFIGGGVIIEKHWILTAAHLFNNISSNQEILIGYGSNNLFQQKLVPIIKHVKHTKFDMINLQNDIALVKTKDPLVYPGQTKIIFLPYPQRREPIKTRNLIIVGWGDVKYKKSNHEGILQEAVMKQTDESKCNNMYHNPINQRQICLMPINNMTSRACQGDSGGPAFEIIQQKPIVVGLSSWTADKCSTHYPNVYTKVSHYLEWICSTVKELN